MLISGYGQSAIRAAPKGGLWAAGCRPLVYVNSEQEVSIESFAEACERFCGPDIGGSSFHQTGLWSFFSVSRVSDLCCSWFLLDLVVNRDGVVDSGLQVTPVSTGSLNGTYYTTGMPSTLTAALTVTRPSFP